MSKCWNRTYSSGSVQDFHLIPYCLNIVNMDVKNQLRRESTTNY